MELVVLPNYGIFCVLSPFVPTVSLSNLRFRLSMSWAVRDDVPVQFSVGTIGGSLAALCSTARFWSLPVSTYIEVSNLRLNGCLDAVLFSLLVSVCVSSGYASVSLRVGSVFWRHRVTFYLCFFDLSYAARLSASDSLKYIITDTMNFVRTPGPMGFRGELAIAWPGCMLRQTLSLLSLCSFRSVDLLATTVGEWWRRHSL